MTLKAGRSKSAGLFYVELDPSTVLRDPDTCLGGCDFTQPDPSTALRDPDTGSGGLRFYSAGPFDCAA